MSSFATVEVNSFDRNERGNLIGSVLSDSFAARWAVDPLGGEHVPVRISVANSDGITLSRAQMTPLRLSNQRPAGDLKYYIYTADRRTHFQAGKRAAIWVNPHELLVMRSDAVSDWKVEESYETSSLIFDATFFKEYVQAPEDLIGKVLRLSPIMQSVLSNMIESAWELTGVKQFEQSGQRLGRAFLDMLQTALTSRQPVGSNQRDRVTALDARLHQIKAFIRKNFADPDLGVSSIAEAIRISPRYVQLAFATVDETPSEFIRNVRLKSSALLLSQPDEKCSITEIAYNCGFNSSSHFSTQFKQHFGISPRDYRNMHMDACAIN